MTFGTKKEKKVLVIVEIHDSLWLSTKNYIFVKLENNTECNRSNVRNLHIVCAFFWKLQKKLDNPLKRF